MPRVTAVVCAAFDPATDATLGRLRDGVGEVVAAREPRHRPHLTLAAATVDAGDLPAVVDVAARTAAGRAAVAIRFVTVGRFARAGAIWLGPAPAPALAALQRAVHAALAAAGWPPAFGAQSDPDRWVPHCTLATRVDRARQPDVVAAVQARFTPFAATVDALATILVGGRGDAGYARLAA